MDAIQILLNDLKKKGLPKAAESLGLNMTGSSIELTMLGKKYHLSKSGVLINDKKANETETIIILNAALCPGNDHISGEWKSYEKFNGTSAHLSYFKHFVEGRLAELAPKIIENLDKLKSEFSLNILDDIGGSDCSFSFEPFPNLRFFCQLYLEDDEFPASARLYFSANADRIMPAQCFEQLALLWIKQLRKLVDSE